MSEPNNNLRVMVWDLGPPAPDVPKPPVQRDAKSDGEKIIAESDFKAAMAVYEGERDSFVVRKREHDKWHQEHGGPFQIEMWTVHAREALERDPQRYALRLPKGKKPGRTHEENQRRRDAEREELLRARRHDPQFGEGAAA